jgi:hypothetical protein
MIVTFHAERNKTGAIRERLNIQQIASYSIRRDRWLSDALPKDTGTA